MASMDSRRLIAGDSGREVAGLYGRPRIATSTMSSDEVTRTFFGPTVQDVALKHQAECGLVPTAIIGERIPGRIDGTSISSWVLLALAYRSSTDERSRSWPTLNLLPRGQQGPNPGRLLCLKPP